MRNAILALATIFVLVCPATAKPLGFQQQGDLSVGTLLGCGTFNPVAGQFTPSSPECAFVTLGSVRNDVIRYVVTITYFDEAGDHQAQMKFVDRDDRYTTTVFTGLLGTTLLTVEVEQCTSEGCYDWHQFWMD